MVSSRSIERACRENFLFMAISGDCAQQFTTLAKFARELHSEITELFTQVLLTCDAQWPIGRTHRADFESEGHVAANATTC